MHVQGDGALARRSPTGRRRLRPDALVPAPEGRLDTDAPTDARRPTRYRYDPADPTPSLGGTGLMTGATVDNGPLEARDDVLLFTSDVLTSRWSCSARSTRSSYVSSSLDHTDFFVRVCDVHPDGRELQRVRRAAALRSRRSSPCDRGRSNEGDADGTFVARVDLWPIGHRFAAGHRLRVQVSSGAHPVYGRNLGTGEPPATAVTMRAANQVLFHDLARPSAVVLPHFPG